MVTTVPYVNAKAIGDVPQCTAQRWRNISLFHRGEKQVSQGDKGDERGGERVRGKTEMRWRGVSATQHLEVKEKL